MLVPLQHYEVIDIAHKEQTLEVVVEATSRKEVLDYLKAHGLEECGVFKEHVEEVYSGICEVSNVVSPKR